MLTLLATVTTDGEEREIRFKPGTARYGRALTRSKRVEISNRIIAVTHTNGRNASASVRLCNCKYEVEVVRRGVAERARLENGDKGATFVLRKGDTVRLVRAQAVDEEWYDLPADASFELRMDGLVAEESQPTDDGSDFDGDCSRMASDMPEFVDNTEECTTSKDRGIIKKLARQLGRGAPNQALISAEGEAAKVVDREYEPVMKVLTSAVAETAALLGSNQNIEASFPQLSAGVKRLAEQNRLAPTPDEVAKRQRAVEERRRALAVLLGK